ncbi:DUF726-domain-containing protein [Trametopsis cervina]|nr:DUF726-domain-containing protein [Trametopsis cervina]
MAKDESEGDLTKVIPPTELHEPELQSFFQYFLRRIASHRNKAEMFAQNEHALSSARDLESQRIQEAQSAELNNWAQALLENAWAACQEPGGGKCPKLTPVTDTSTAGLPPLPSEKQIKQLLHTILFIHLTTSKAYHAHTRAFLSTFGPLDEDAIAATLKNPEHAVREVDRKSKTDQAKEEQAERNKTLRRVGLGLAAVGGGVLVGMTGGLAAPFVGAGVTTVLGWVGVGGTAAGMLASGLAGSSVVCGALFGAYGSKKSAEMVSRYIKEVEDLAIVPVREPRETLAVRLCVSGWLESSEDVSAPWTVLGGEDTFALQWEVEALMNLSNALYNLVRSQAMQYLKSQIIKQTIFAALAAALSPTAWLKIGQIIDNPWMTAKARASKTARVLGVLIAERVLGNRPITLVGYSLGGQVIFEALQYLATLPPEQTAGLVQDVFLFGAPVPADESAWASVRRVVSGRLVNGYSTNDYILAVLARASGVSWGVSGLKAVEVQGVENVECKEVDGHLKWRGMVGRCLQQAGAPGVQDDQVEAQLKNKEKQIEKVLDLSKHDVKKILKQGDGSDEMQEKEAAGAENKEG